MHRHPFALAQRAVTQTREIRLQVTRQEELAEPQIALELQGPETYTITLYEKDDDGYPAQSAFTPYTFYISGWQGDNILKAFTEEEDT